ncbi:MAG TPA: peptidase M28, partial [Cyclobacteriaceae bacterium]|nr:peptidase M28 [Cyclobacteriaceae bacterium]
MKKIIVLFIFSGIFMLAQAQQTPPPVDMRIYDIVSAVSAQRLEKDIRTLANFGTRNTFSDTVSATRGIGAARRWIKSEFDNISKACNNCLEVFYQKDLVTKAGNNRVPHDAWIVNVVAIQRGTEFPNNFIIMSGDIDSRASNTMNFEIDAPG